MSTHLKRLQTNSYSYYFIQTITTSTMKTCLVNASCCFSSDQFLSALLKSANFLSEGKKLINTFNRSPLVKGKLTCLCYQIK